MSVNMDMNILIVDDFKTMLQIMGSLLKQLGFKNIDEADSGTSALEKLRSGKDYGLIISDWNMEPVSGYQLLKEVRADDKLRDTPFIIMTGQNKTEHVIAAREAGVSNYVVKPFSAPMLKTKLAHVLGPF
ncbi:MAG: response regulator [Alphaproteobacteria bacterium]|nr:response regulator [Alphaproteobacteria bacterium]